MRLKTNITCLSDFYVCDYKTDEFGDYDCEFIDPLEYLPKNQSVSSKNTDGWKSYNHYWKIPKAHYAENVIERFVGKPVNDAFSYYIKHILKDYYYKYFNWEYEFIPRYYYLYFDKDNPWHISNKFIIDDNGLIQLNPDRYIRSSSLNWKKIDPQSYYEKISAEKKSNKLKKYLKSQIDYKAILKERKNELKRV